MPNGNTVFARNLANGQRHVIDAFRDTMRRGARLTAPFEGDGKMRRVDDDHIALGTSAIICSDAI